LKPRRFTLSVLLSAFAVTLLFWLEFHASKVKGVPFTARIILFALLNLTFIALFVLMFFVGKSLLQVYLERKHRVMGYKFKTKLVVIFVVLTLIPSLFLFIVSSGVVTNYVDRWFDPQIKQPLNLSIEMAKSAYEAERTRTLAYAKAIASGSAVPDRYIVSHLDAIPENASETVKAGFDGKADVEVISRAKGDIVRAVAPVYSHGRQQGIAVVESQMPAGISRNAGEITEAYKNYLMLESWKTPIKANYLLILSFFTLLTVFMALWVGLRTARGITAPVQLLAQATEQVAKGDLETRVEVRREDEIGLLINSFNNMVRELGESKQSLQQALKESDRRRLIIENILENIRSGVISLDAAGNILTINNAAARILDIAPEQIVNMNYSVLLSLLKSEELKDTVKGIRVKEFKGLQKEMYVAAGRRRILLRIFITTLGGPEDFLGTLAVFDDLTDVVRAQKALAWQEVARRIAHEIKNPLTPIKLSTDHMIKKWQNGDEDFGVVFERSTKTIMKEVESLKRLVNEFSRFGKMPEVQKAPVRISTVIEAVADLYKDYKGIAISVERADDEPLVDLDAEQFKRVIINIVDNAVQAMQNQGRIDISITHNVFLNRISVDIVDNGPGIREEDKEKLFLPYFSTKKDGTGLGLAIASRVIAEHRGYIRVRDNAPSGTIFTIELPIKES
jgi:two-component system nitrogen regulation sensor histidine kinase NtrY